MIYSFIESKYFSDTNINVKAVNQMDVNTKQSESNSTVERLDSTQQCLQWV
jgi:hypothetical protein